MSIAPRRILLGLIHAVMATWFLFGVFAYPDAPIHPCSPERHYRYTEHPDGYCGKQGQSHTAEEFRHFKVWEDNLMWIWPVGMLALFVMGKGRRKPGD